MRQEVMDIVLKATDNASPTFEAVQNAAEDLGQSLDNVGDEATDDMRQLEDGADQAEDDVRKLGDEAKKTGEEVDDLGDKSKSSGATMQMAFQNIADGVMRAKEGVVELGRNLMETLELAGQQEQQETFLKMNIGAEGAAKQMKIINDLVADLPGDDVAIGGLLSQAAAKNAGITADELKRMGVNAADYFAAMSNYGKSSVEAQQDLTNYILTGNTAELERSPILQAHIDKLKEANTVEERNKALQEAMNEEGWSGISQQDTYNNKLETFTAMLDRGKRQMGEMFLDAAGGAMDFIGNLDEATGGVLGMGLAIGTVAGGPMIDLVTGVGQVATGLNALKDSGAVTALAEMLPFIVADEEAFFGLALAEDFALWPLIAIVAAIVAIGVAIYEVGKYFGWWTDVGSMIDSIWAGIQRLWSAFINHPDVQSFLSALTDAWNWLVPAVTGVVNSVLKFFGVSSSSKFDFVRALIDTIGMAWNALKTPIMIIITVIKKLWDAIVKWYNKTKVNIEKVKHLFEVLPNWIRGAISGVVDIIAKPFRDAYSNVKKTVDKVKDKVNDLKGGINIDSITGKLTKPFKDAWDSIKKTIQKIKDRANDIPVIGGAFGGEDLSFYGGEDLVTKSSSYSTEKLSVDMNQNINLSLDLRNVPSGLDERTLAGLINETLDSKEFINRLVNNPDFQSLDSKVKQRIVLKSNRANGRGV